MTSKQFDVAGTADLRDGEMKQFPAGDTSVLVARINGNYHAVAATCTHYGAPLAEGVLNSDRIVCPWHHACFNATTGDLLEPPALDSLEHYELTIKDERILVAIPEGSQGRRVPDMTAPDPASDKRVFVILGAGAAGYSAVQTLRGEGFRGRIVLITREDRLPYDRPNLSKDYLQGHAEPEWMPLRPDEFFDEHKIEVLSGKEVTRVDAGTRTISFKDSEKLSYDALLIATGGVPRTLKIPGSDLKNILTLRSFDDSDAIIAATNGAKHVVIIGASFIGMEGAASLKSRGVEVTVVAPGKTPFETTLGPEIGALFKDLHEKNGVQFKLGAKIVRFTGSGAVDGIEIDSGEKIAADLVLVGVGVRPATDFLNGVNLNKDGSIVVDKYLRAASDLYAAGDVASFPSAYTGEQQRIEHWRTALQQGRIAALNMAGKETPYASVPFFWTQQFESTLRYVGHASGWDEIIVDGNIASQDFVAFFIKNDRALAVASMNRDQPMAAIEELMREARMPSAKDLKAGPVDFVEKLHRSV